MSNPQQVLSTFFEKYPFTKDVIQTLNDNNIRYGIFAGFHVGLLTNYRPVSDMDFLVNTEDILKLKDLFPDAKIRDNDHGINISLGENDIIEFNANLKVSMDDSNYHLDLSDLAWANHESYNFDNMQINALNPFDTILLKAMLQRGKDIGKHDLEDIEEILKVVTVDKDYAQKRIKEVNPDERLLKCLREYSII